MQLPGWKAALALISVVGGVIWSEDIVRNPPPPGPIRVVYWEKWEGFEAQAMRDVVNAFNKSQKRIFVDYLPVSGVENKTLMAIAGGAPPDLAGLYGPNVAQYADDAAIQNLDDFCKEAGITRGMYVDPYIDVCTYRNHLFALPSAVASTALHWDKDMFKAAGLDPDHAPVTLEELDQMSERLYSKDPEGKLKTTGFLPSEPGWWNYAWGYWFGGRLWDGKTKITAYSPENIRAFKWVAGFGKKYGAQELQSFRGGFGTFSSPQNAFMSEQVAMELQGVWMANFIGNYHPSMKWGAAPFPYPADRPDLAKSTIADVDVLVIPRGASHPKEAFEFMKFVESQQGMEILCLGQKKNSALKVMPPDFFARHPNPFIRLFSSLPLGKNNIIPPKMGIWPEYQAAMNDAFDSVNLGTKTPEEALMNVQNIMQPKLDEHLARLKTRGLIP